MELNRKRRECNGKIPCPRELQQLTTLRAGVFNHSEKGKAEEEFEK